MEQELLQKLDEILTLLRGLGPTPSGGMLSRREAAKVLGVGLTTISEMIRRGEIGTRKIGTRVLIPQSELKRMQEPEGPGFRQQARKPKGYNAQEEAEKVRASLRKRQSKSR